MQCAHSIPTNNVPNTPNMSPPFLNALDMARVPVLMLLFIKCIKAPVALEKLNKMLKKPLSVGIWSYPFNTYLL